MHLRHLNGNHSYIVSRFCFQYEAGWYTPRSGVLLGPAKLANLVFEHNLYAI